MLGEAGICLLFTSIRRPAAARELRVSGAIMRLKSSIAERWIQDGASFPVHGISSLAVGGSLCAICTSRWATEASAAVIANSEP